MKITKRTLVALVLMVFALAAPILLSTPTSAYAVTSAGQMLNEAKKTPTKGNYVIVFSYSRHELRIFKITNKKVYDKKKRKYVNQKQYAVHRTYKACGCGTRGDRGHFRLNYGKTEHKNSSKKVNGKTYKYHYCWIRGYDRNGTMGANQTNAIHSYLYAGNYQSHKKDKLLNVKNLQLSSNPSKLHSSGGCTRVPEKGASFICALPRGTGYSIMA